MKIVTSGEKFESSRVTKIRRSFKRCIVCKSSIEYKETTITVVRLTLPTQDLPRYWLQNLPSQSGFSISTESILTLPSAPHHIIVTIML